MNMEPQVWNQLWQTAAGTGLGGLVLVMAIWWLQKSNAALLSELKMEREDRITSLENAEQACRVDRLELHKQVDSLHSQIVDIYKGMLNKQDKSTP